MSELRVTIGEVMSWHPCGWNGKDDGKNYTQARVKKLFGRRKYMTALKILELDIPARDRLWAVLREGLIDARTLRLFVCDCAERALKHERKAGREPDARSWNAIKIARRYARGEATRDELDAAAADAYAAAAAADGNAAYAAAAAAYAADANTAADDAAYAAYTAADDYAERKWQVKHLKEMLRAA